MQYFFDECVEVGPDRCPFYAPTAQDISRNLTTLYNAVRAQPVPIRTATSYGLVDYNRLRMTVFTSLYKPYTAFLTLASGLAELAAGDGTRIYEMLETLPFQCSCNDSPDFSVVGDAGIAIACNDGKAVPSSLKELEKYFDEVMETSSWSEIWAGRRVNCV